ncbi:hypothetical protein Tco_1359204, partial [Tanacetum coccineum]
GSSCASYVRRIEMQGIAKVAIGGIWYGVIHLVMWIIDSGCSKHMTGNLKLVKNFVEKFMGTVRFGNDHFAATTRYNDYLQGNLTIYYHENYLEDFKSDLENLEEIYKMMNGRVEYPHTQNASPSKIKEPYEPSPKMYSYEQPSFLGSNFVGETLRKSDQLHQTFEKSSIAMTRNLYNMIELPKSQPKRTYNEDLECEIVMVKIPKCMAWLDNEPIGDLDTIGDKVDNPSP